MPGVWHAWNVTCLDWRVAEPLGAALSISACIVPSSQGAVHPLLGRFAVLSVTTASWQILKYGSANILFLAMTVCVPLVRSVVLGRSWEFQMVRGRNHE